MDSKQIIELLGGPSKVGRRLGVKAQAVSQWTSKNRFPADKVPGLERLAREAKVPIRAETLRPDVDWGILRIPYDD